MCDVGLVRLHEDSSYARLDTSTGKKGSICWCSPKLLDNAALAATSDVYAWAWFIWEVGTHVTHFIVLDDKIDGFADYDGGVTIPGNLC